MFDRLFGNNNNNNQAQGVSASAPAASAPPVQDPPVSQSDVVVPMPPAASQLEVKPEDISFDEEYKNKIGLQLTEAMLKGIEDGNMTESEMGVVSGYILDNIDNVHTHTELNVFLQILAQRWKVFKQVRKVEAGIEKASGDSAKAEEIASLIHENKIDDALTAAHNATAAVN